MLTLAFNVVAERGPVGSMVRSRFKSFSGLSVKEFLTSPGNSSIKLSLLPSGFKLILVSFRYT